MNEIKQTRLDLNITQVEASRLTGVPLRTLQDWEGNKSTPPPYVAKWYLMILRNAKKPAN